MNGKVICMGRFLVKRLKESSRDGKRHAEAWERVLRHNAVRHGFKIKGGLGNA